LSDFEIFYIDKRNLTEFSVLMTDNEFDIALKNNDIYVGARIFGIPVAYSRISFRNSDTAVISYLFVVAKYRRRGLATQILHEILQNNSIKFVNKFLVEYRKEKNKHSAIEIFLENNGFCDKKLISVVCRTDFRILDAKWFDKVSIPEKFKVVKWSEVEDDLKENLCNDSQKDDWERLRLSPFSDDCKDYFDLNSLCIIYENNIIGWNITTKINEKTIRYSNLYVRSKYKKLGYSIALLGQAIKIQQKYRPDMDCGLWCASAENRQMVNFITRRMFPYVDYIKYEYRMTYKKN